MRDPTARNRQIFTFILEEPSSLYRIYTRSGKKIGTGTISKVIKGLKDRVYIRTYQPKRLEEKGKLERDLWGPTIAGIVTICVVDEKLLKNVESIFEKWLPHSEFLDELKLHGFDVNLVKKQPSKANEIFQKYIQLCVDRRKQMMDLLKNPSLYDIATLDNIGESLLVRKNPEYKKILYEIYRYMPGVQKTVNEMFKGYFLEFEKLKKLGKRKT